MLAEYSAFLMIRLRFIHSSDQESKGVKKTFERVIFAFMLVPTSGFLEAEVGLHQDGVN